jgi:hypothetical protein
MTIDKLPATTILFLIFEGFIYGFAIAAVLFRERTMPKTHLTITKREPITRMDLDANGKPYDTGDIIDVLYHLDCECGSSTTLFKSEFDERRPRSCGIPSCQFSNRPVGRPPLSKEPKIPITWNCPLSLYLKLEVLFKSSAPTSRNQVISKLIQKALDDSNY